MVLPLSLITIQIVVGMMNMTNFVSKSKSPFCLGRLIGGPGEKRKFKLFGMCDMRPLPEPWKKFPPSMYIIGVQKSGTSSAERMLRKNTELDIGLKKEINFLNYHPEVFKARGSPRTMYEEYKNLMSSSLGPSLDASPRYSVWGNLFIENLIYTTNLSQNNLPKALLLLRNPLTRLYSHYNMKKKHQTDKNHPNYGKVVPKLAALIRPDLVDLNGCGIDISITDPNFHPRMLYNNSLMGCFHHPSIFRRDNLLAQGMYSWHLEMIRRSAKPSRVIIVCFRDLNADNEGFLRMIANFIGVHVDIKGRFQESIEISDCPTAYRKSHKLDISPKLEVMLKQFYRTWNEVLRRDFKIDCGWDREMDC